MSGGLIPFLPLSLIRYQGMKARDEGMPAGTCQYRIATDEWHVWLDGWHNQDPFDEDDASGFKRLILRDVSLVSGSYRQPYQ